MDVTDIPQSTMTSRNLSWRCWYL